MEENKHTPTSNDPLNPNAEQTEQPIAIKHKSKISQKSLLVLQYAAWLMGIIALIDIIIMSIAPKKVASLLFRQAFLDNQNGIEMFQEVIPHFSILLVIIALLFYIISRLLRSMIRYRNEINQLKDFQKTKK